MQDLKEKIQEVNKILKEAEPKSFSEDHKGYKGYKPQYVIDAINKAGIRWSMKSWKVDTYASGRKNKNGGDIMEVLVKVRVALGERVFDAYASHPIMDDYGDAVKSAQTDAMKKALSHYSIGNRAYHGLLK